jgi:heme-degrading monooxygenase HmoA
VAVIMIAEVPGADASFVDGLVAAGVPDAMANAPGFVSHISGITSSGFRVIEVWESRDAHRAWVDQHINPNLPPGMGPIPTEYVELRLEVPKR